MTLVTLFSLYIFLLLATRLYGDQKNFCLTDGFSSECTSFIRSGYGLTQEEFERKRSRIKSFTDSNRLQFNIAMSCYAIGMRMPTAGGCALCNTFDCWKLFFELDCKLFCSQTPKIPLVSAQSQAPLINQQPHIPSTTGEQQLTSITTQHILELRLTSDPSPTKIPIPQPHYVASSTDLNGTNAQLDESQSNPVKLATGSIICIVLVVGLVLIIVIIIVLAYHFYFKTKQPSTF